MNNVKTFDSFLNEDSGLTVKFKQWTCKLNFAKYRNNDRTAIELVDSMTAEPIAMATINLPDEDLVEDEVIIKDYSENEGMVESLVDAGVISKPIRTVESGFINAPVCKLLIATE